MFISKDIVNVVVEHTNVAVEHTNTTEPIVHSTNHTQTQTPNMGTWSSIVAKNIPVTETSRNDKAQIILMKMALLLLSHQKISW